MIPGKKENHPTFGKSFGFALQGLRYAFRTERNIKIMAALFVFALILAFFLRCDASEWGIIFVGAGVVFGAELFNTAIETIVDLVSPEYHTLAGHAKDISAAAVYALSFLVGVAGIIVFITAAFRLFAS